MCLFLDFPTAKNKMLSGIRCLDMAIQALEKCKRESISYQHCVLHHEYQLSKIERLITACQDL